MSTDQAWFLSSLWANNFAHSHTLANAVQASGLTADDLSILRHDQSPQLQVMHRAKHNRTLRPGTHVCPTELLRASTIAANLEEWYWRCAAEFDEESVFYLMLTGASSPERQEGRVIRSVSHSHKAFLAKARSHAEHYGGWVARLDIGNFYGSVDGNLILDTFGRKGLNIPSSLVDEVSIWADTPQNGLPQGPLLSDLIARLVLTVFDRSMHDLEIPYTRFSDDILIFGQSLGEIKERVRLASGLIRSIGLSTNQDKTVYQGPHRLKWIQHGIFWALVPIEHYETGEEFLDEYCVQTPSPETRLDSVGVCHSVDWLRLYNDESAPGKPARSELGHKRTLAELGRRHSHIAVRDSQLLVSDRSSNIRYLLCGLSGSDKEKAACYAFIASKYSPSLEDDWATIAMLSPSKLAADIARRVLTHHRCKTATRIVMCERLARSELSVELFSEKMPGKTWLDEHAAFARLLSEVGGSVARTAKNRSLAADPGVGLIYEVVESLYR